MTKSRQQRKAVCTSHMCVPKTHEILYTAEEYQAQLKIEFIETNIYSRDKVNKQHLRYRKPFAKYL